MKTIKLAMLVRTVTAVPPLLLGSLSASANSSGDNIVKIATLSHHENGCSESWHPFVVDVPNPDKLDLDFEGNLAGISIRETEGNNGHAFANVAFVDGQKKVAISLYAKGAGNRVNNPFNHGSVCVGGEGASEGVEIYAHYKAGA